MINEKFTSNSTPRRKKQHEYKHFRAKPCGSRYLYLPNQHGANAIEILGLRLKNLSDLSWFRINGILIGEVPKNPVLPRVSLSCFNVVFAEGTELFNRLLEAYAHHRYSDWNI